MTGRANFYHLTRSAPEALVPPLIARARKEGWAVDLRSTQPGMLKRLDDKLWLAKGFQAHGLEDGVHDAMQPVLLRLVTDDAAPASANDALCILALDGAAVSAEDCRSAKRVCIIFNGHDQLALQVARDQWRSLVAGGIAADYWSEETDKWEKKHSSAGKA